MTTGDEGTFGRLEEYLGAVLNFRFFTGELPYRDNHNSVSCIPMGVYRCQWTVSNKFPQGTFQVIHVPLREGIRIHKGNWCGDTSLGWKSDVEGCILLGKLQETRANPYGKPQKGVFDSTTALIEFSKKIGTCAFDLEIVGP
jgi:hypothetical protein